MPCCECAQSLLKRNVGTRYVGDPQPLVAEFWSEIHCAGLLSGVMDNAKKYLLAGDLEPDQDKGSDMRKKCDRRHRRRSLEQTHLALLCTV